MNGIVTSCKILLVFLFVALFSQLSYSTIYYVNANIQGGNQDGSSWENAFPILNSAINAAQYGDTIWVAQGTYRPTSGTNRIISFTLKNGVKMFGGFTGTETALDERDWETNSTILSGDIGVQGDSTDNSYNVVFCNSADSTTILDGFIITGGNADDNTQGTTTARPKSGGGLYLIGILQTEDTRPVIANCKFENNYARYNGGGMFIRSVLGAGATPILRNCNFLKNTSINGGGIYKEGGSELHEMVIENCSFEGNEADFGGGIYYINDSGDKNVKVLKCTFSGNYSFLNGGGLYQEVFNDLSVLEITDCVFEENFSIGEGSAIMNFPFVYDTVRIDSCKFDSNKSLAAGTIAVFDGGLIEIKNSLFLSNSIGILGFSGQGACIHVEFKGDVIFENCLFEKNSSFAGSIYNKNSGFNNPLLDIINSTFFSNESTTGLMECTVGTPKISIINSLFFKNSLSQNGKLIDCLNNDITISHSLIDVSDCSVISNGNINCGPGMIYLQDPLFTDTAAGDFTLLPCSPAIDAGDNVIVDSLGITTDLAGNPRILPEGASGGTVDMGAYEAPALAVAAVTVLQPSCGGAEGAAAFQMEHGCAPFSYAWTSDTGSGAGAAGLLPGTYTFTITDALGKTAEAEVEIPQAPAVSAMLSTIPFNCTNTTGGSAGIIPTSGTAPFSYVWSNTDTTATATGLLPGTYTVTLADVNGCTFTDTVEVETTGQLSLSISLTPIHCHDSADGTAAITPFGGTAPFAWQWETGEMDSLLTGISGGSYSVTVTDAVGCTGDLQFTLSAPPPLNATATGQNPACFGTASGTATVVATGGTPSYSYLWSNAQTSATISQLLPGTYFVTVTDANQCSDTASVVIASPPALTLSIEATETLCFGEENGTAAAVVSGGTPPYSFDWDNGQMDSLLAGLAPGSYAITVTDANGCIETEGINITGSTAIQVLLDTIIHASGVSASDGAVILQQVFGGQPPYSYLWSNPDSIVGATQNLEDIPPGNYVLTVTDSAPGGCTEEFFFTVDVEVATGEVKDVSFRAVIVPNPSGREKLARLSIDARQSQVLEVEVHDLYGRCLAVETFNADAGLTTYDLTQGLVPGVYWVIIRNNSGGSMALKWVVM